GRASIDQHDNRLAIGDITRLCVGPVAFAGVAALGQHNRALLQESVGNCDRLIEKPAWIIAQVDHIALELGAYPLLQVFDSLLYIFVGIVALERLDFDPADIALGTILDWIDTDDVPDDLGLKRSGNTLAQDR